MFIVRFDVYKYVKFAPDGSVLDTQKVKDDLWLVVEESPTGESITPKEFKDICLLAEKIHEESWDPLLTRYVASIGDAVREARADKYPNWGWLIEFCVRTLWNDLQSWKIK